MRREIFATRMMASSLHHRLTSSVIHLLNLEGPLSRILDRWTPGRNAISSLSGDLAWHVHCASKIKSTGSWAFVTQNTAKSWPCLSRMRFAKYSHWNLAERMGPRSTHMGCISWISYLFTLTRQQMRLKSVVWAASCSDHRPSSNWLSRS